MWPLVLFCFVFLNKNTLTWKFKLLCPYIHLLLYVHAKSLQPCLTLHNPIDCGLPGSFVSQMLQAGKLEWVARPSSKGSSWSRDRTPISCNSYLGRWILPLSHLGSPFTQLSNLVTIFFNPLKFILVMGSEWDLTCENITLDCSGLKSI